MKMELTFKRAVVKSCLYALLVCCCSHAKILVIMETARVRVHVNTGVLSQEPGTVLYWLLSLLKFDTTSHISVTQEDLLCTQTCSMLPLNRCNHFSECVFTVTKSPTTFSVVHLSLSVNHVIVHSECTFPAAVMWEHIEMFYI